MTLNVTLSDESAEHLASLAKATSRTPEQIAASVIERNLKLWQQADEALAPVREAFAASGMTEDEAVELFEAEKHAWRAEQRAAGEQ
jgi:predicted transcriptional regulator